MPKQKSDKQVRPIMHWLIIVFALSMIAFAALKLYVIAAIGVVAFAISACLSNPPYPLIRRRPR